MATQPESIMARVSSSLAARWKYVKTIWPGRKCGHSVAIGSFTLMTISACSQISWGQEATVAPTPPYASSVNPLPVPAPVSTKTVCPSPTRTSAPAGTKATRSSFGLISFGTPIFIHCSAFHSPYLKALTFLLRFGPVRFGDDLLLGEKVDDRLALRLDVGEL